LWCDNMWFLLTSATDTASPLGCQASIVKAAVCTLSAWANCKKRR
jgi:hypothetical protein